MADEHFSYGGQAVIEGVMIRGRNGFAVACRLADGGIKVEKQRWQPLSQRTRFLSLPIIRGTPALIDALLIGYRSLILSANNAVESEGQKPPSSLHYALSIVVALAISIGAFVLLPTALTHRVHAASSGGNVLKYVLEGIIRVAIFIGFVKLTSRMADMRRVYQYHGAEHKVIHAYESTGRYRPEDTEAFATLHPRCGTSFIFTVLIVGIFVHALVSWQHGMAVVLLSRLILLPVVAGISYEVIRAAGKRKDSRLMGALVWPGMMLQRVTTQPPTPDMIEVAIQALEGALELDGAKSPA